MDNINEVLITNNANQNVLIVLGTIIYSIRGGTQNRIILKTLIIKSHL